MLTLIIGRGKTGKTYRLLERVKNCPGMNMAQRIVIVPEQLSHSTERRLSALCGDEISFVSEVLSFTRLYNRVCSIYGGGARNTLDTTGRILTAKLALDSIRHRLKVFAAASGRSEFLGNMVEMIDELKRYEITPQILLETAGKSQGIFAEKLSEIALILSAYEALTATGAFDPRDHLSLLVGILQEGGYARGRSFFVDGFTDFSTQEIHVLSQLLQDSDDMTVTVPCDDLTGSDPLFNPGRETAQRLIQMAESCGKRVQVIHADYERPLPEALTYLEKHLLDYGAEPYEGNADCITLGEFQDRLSECRRCGAVLKKQAMEGMRYRDMTVAACDEAGYGGLMEAVFRTMGIPLYRSTKRGILSHPAAAFVLQALEAAVDNLDTETVTAYLKTGYSGATSEECDRIENYAVVWRIRGSKWQTEWKMHPDGYDGAIKPEVEEELKQLNQTKDAVIAPLLKLRQSLRTAKNAREQMKAIYQLLEETKLYDLLQQEIARDTEEGRLDAAQETAQVYSTLLECLKQINGVLGKTTPRTEELLRVIKLALSQYQLGTIPAVLDAVNFGSIEQVRGTEPKLLYVLGANEGLMPAAVGGGSFLSERERGILRDDFDITLAPDSEKNMERQLLTAYSALTAPVEQLYVSWCSQNGTAQPSFLTERMGKLFPIRGVSLPVETEYTGEQAAQDYLIHRDDLDYKTLTAVIGQAAREITFLAEAILQGRQGAEPRSEQVTAESAKALFGDPVALTASRLDQLGKCPLNFFLNYGLKARIRKEASFDASEFGTFVHYILEKTVNELSQKETITPLDREESSAMVREHLEEYAKNRMGDMERSAREKYLFARNGDEASAILQEITEEFSLSDFRPRYFELKFGDGGAYPAVMVNGKLGAGKLTGVVDRGDVWETEQETYLRVVDYKTGTKKFDYTELYSGIGMQMLLYLFAMTKENVVPTGVMYMPAKLQVTSQDAEKESRKRSGLILEEPQVLEAMEHSEKSRFLPVSGRKGLGDYVVSREKMEQLRQFTESKMGEAVDHILSGDFSANPFYRGRSKDPCSYCDYLEVCQRDPQFRRTHYHEEMTPEDFWKKMGDGNDE